MAKKIQPQFEIRCYPRSAIPRATASCFAVSDIFSDMVNMGRGDAQPLTIEGSTHEAEQWQGAESTASFALSAFNKVEFVRLAANGRVYDGASDGARGNNKRDELGGWVIQGREAPLDNKIGTTTLDTADIVDYNWTATQGTWKTVRPPDEPRRCWITNTSKANVTAQAKSAGDLPKNRSFRFDAFLTASRAHTGRTPPSMRISWGNYLYSVFLQHGQKPQVHKYGGGKWNLIRRLEGAEITRFVGGRCTIRVRRLNGFLRIGINGIESYVAESKVEGGKSKGFDSTWPAGKVVVEVKGAHARCNLSTIKYSEANGTLFEGTFTRYVAQVAGITAGEGQLIGLGKGWNKDGTTCAITPTQGGAYAANSISYQATLTASPDGIDTPFLTSATVEFTPEWLTNDPDYLDIAPAVTRGTISSAMPGQTSMASATIDVDLQVLYKLEPQWGSYIGKRCPIEILQRWYYEDGSVGSWFKMFKGYIIEPSPSASGGNEYRTTLTCYDSSIRLQGNNARIDARYSAPMDFVWQKNAANGGSTKLYGWDCVQEIIDKSMGREAGGLLETYFPPNHYPLLSVDTDDTGGWMFVSALASAGLTGGKSVTVATPHFPPPFGDDALSWILRFADLDKAVFYYGWPDGDTSNWPRPIYGRLNEIIAGRSTKILPDKLYNQSDENSFLLSYSIRNVAEKEINAIDVWGSPPNGIASAFHPALPFQMASARLPASDPNSAERTWERKAIVRTDLANLNTPGDFIPEFIAQGFIDDIAGVEIQFPQFTIEGDASLQWGDRVQAKILTDSCQPIDIGLHGLDFVIENVEHSFVPNESFSTTLSTFAKLNNTV